MVRVRVRFRVSFRRNGTSEKQSFGVTGCTPSCDESYTRTEPFKNRVMPTMVNCHGRYREDKKNEVVTPRDMQHVSMHRCQWEWHKHKRFQGCKQHLYVANVLIPCFMFTTKIILIISNSSSSNITYISRLVSTNEQATVGLHCSVKTASSVPWAVVRLLTNEIAYV